MAIVRARIPILSHLRLLLPRIMRGQVRELMFNVAAALRANPAPFTRHSIVEVHKLEGSKHVGFGQGLKTVVIPTLSKVSIVSTCER